MLHFVYKLYSTGPWMSFAGMIIVLAATYFIIRRKLKMFLLVFVLLGTIGVLCIQYLPFLKSDYTSIKRELDTYLESPSEYVELHKKDSASAQSRLVGWSVAMDFVAKNPMGVGTGDVKDELLKEYERRGMESHLRLKLNPHNQYLQTSIAVGVVPGLFLLFVFGFYIWTGFKRRNYNLIALSSLFMIGCFFESLFERQWGVLFFMFFLVIFLLSSDNGKKPASAE